jgi:hypothetical protein
MLSIFKPVESDQFQIGTRTNRILDLGTYHCHMFPERGYYLLITENQEEREKLRKYLNFAEQYQNFREAARPEFQSFEQQGKPVQVATGLSPLGHTTRGEIVVVVFQLAITHGQERESWRAFICSESGYEYLQDEAVQGVDDISEQLNRLTEESGGGTNYMVDAESPELDQANVKTMDKPNKEELKEREALVIGQYGGILPQYEAFYIVSILYAADRCEDAFQRFDAAVTATGSDAVIMATAQEALTHAGVLSRFFWPMKNGALSVARGKRLREAFNLDDSSPLKWRRLRNSFEHFDEDLDRFLLIDRVGCFFPGPMIGSHQLADEKLANIFKLIDPEQGVCVVLGEKFEFRPIRTEVQRVLALAQEMNAQGSRLRRSGGGEEE